MSDIAAQNKEQGGGEKGHNVKSLKDLVHDIGKWREKQEKDINFIIVGVSSALPEGKRTQPLVKMIKDSVLSVAIQRSGKAYLLSECDLGLLVKLNETSMTEVVRDLKVEMLRTFESHFPGIFGTIDQSRLVVSYELKSNYKSAADRVRSYIKLYRST